MQKLNNNEPRPKSAGFYKKKRVFQLFFFPFSVLSPGYLTLLEKVT